MTCAVFQASRCLYASFSLPSFLLHRVELDVGTVDGSFAMHFLFFTFTHAYQNLTNIAVRSVEMGSEVVT